MDPGMETTVCLLEPQSYPYDLLLLADPSRVQIERYLSGSVVLGLMADSGLGGRRLGGVAVLVPHEPERWEVMNIAIAEDLQGGGLGKRLLLECLEECRRRGVRRVEIGTGNSSLRQLGLYQKAGFRIVGVIPDYFTAHYPEPIFEDGLQCRDMVRLARDL